MCGFLSSRYLFFLLALLEFSGIYIPTSHRCGDILTTRRRLFSVRTFSHNFENLVAMHYYRDNFLTQLGRAGKRKKKQKVWRQAYQTLFPSQRKLKFPQTRVAFFNLTGLWRTGIWDARNSCFFSRKAVVPWCVRVCCVWVPACVRACVSASAHALTSPYMR